MAHRNVQNHKHRPATTRWSLRPVVRPFTASPFPPARTTARCRALLGLDRFFKGGSPAQQQPRQESLLDPDSPELEPQFQAWLRREGLATQPLLLRQCGREGRGLVSSRPLPRGEVLLRLPDSLLLTAGRAAEESCLAPLLRNLPTTSSSSSGSGSAAAAAAAAASQPPLPEWSLLALLLAEVRGRLAAGDLSSRWSPYVAVLPQRPGTVLDWPAKEAQQLLRGSPLLRLAASITSAAAASWGELEPLIARGRAEGLVPEHVTLGKADLDWAFGVLLSRCIRLPGRGDLQVLAPWADLLNHDVAAEAGCHLDWDAGAGVSGAGAGGAPGALVLRADRPYAAGQQVYVSYGPKSSGELLLSYGFCPPPASNPNQDYKLLVGVDRRGDPLAELKVEALARQGLPAELEFPLKLEGLPEGLLPYLALLEARPRVAQETFELASLLFEVGTFPLLDGEDTLGLALRGLSGRCAAAIKDYPTTMEVDQALAAGAVAAVAGRQSRGPRRGPTTTSSTSPPSSLPPSPSSSSSSSSSPSSLPTLGTEDVYVSSLRAAAVASIRVRERQILQRTQAAAAGQLAELRRAAAASRARRR